MSKMKTSIGAAIWILVFVVMALIFSSCEQDKLQESQNLHFPLTQSYKYVLPAVVTVRGDSTRDYDDRICEMGSGYFFNKYVLTMNHIVDNIVKGTESLRLWNGQIIIAKVVATDEDLDLALLQVDPNDLADYKIPEFELEFMPQIGEMVFIVGSPFSFDGTLTVGVLSRRAATISLFGFTFPCDTYLIDAFIEGGNSGSPVFNIRRKVIGIVTGFAGKFTVVVPAYHISSFLREHGVLQ